MDPFILWLEDHAELAGWAQLVGSMVALALTYFLASAPVRQRKRQLERAAERLLLNGYEAVESYHRTSEQFLPFAMSLRVAAQTMMGVSGEIDKFPIFELEDQGSRSAARHLVAMSMNLKVINLCLENSASELDTREGTSEDQKMIREFVGQQLDLLRDMVTGKELIRPEWKPNE